MKQHTTLMARHATVAYAAVMLCMAPAAHAAVTISTAATSNMSCVSGVCSPTAADAVLNVNDLTSMLASGNVTVNTGTGSLAQQVEDIVVASTFNWASANALTLDAFHSVMFTAPVAVNGAAPVSLVTNDGGTGGLLSFGKTGSIAFASLSSALTVNGLSYSLVGSVKSLAAAVANNPSGNYALAADYDARGDKTYRAAPIPTAVSGHVEGLGNTISGLKIAATVNSASIGLFAQVDGTVSDFVLADESVDIQGEDDAVGGLVGVNNGTVLGGVVSGTIRGGKLGSTGAFVGGLVGLDNGVVAYSHATAKVEGRNKADIGGLVGASLPGTIINSYATGNIIGEGAAAGGLIGYAAGTVSGSFATGNVSGRRDGLGGLAGCGSEGTISNSYATGSAKGEDADGGIAGGLIGCDFDGGQDGGTITASYATGTESGGIGALDGGFAGEVQYSGATTNDYWDTTTSGTQQAVGQGSSSGITGLTTKQLKSGLPAGFDPTIWAQSKKINNGLPYLINNPPQ